MTEYIKREDAIKALIRHVSALTDEEIEYTLNKIPAADVVEVVRCKDCKHYEVLMDVSTSWMCCLPGEFQRKMPKDGYCSYGERR